MNSWTLRLQNIKPLNPVWRQKARARLDSQTRPLGSLGFLESEIERLAAIQQKEEISLHKKRILIFAADHGIEAEGVSAYPREVTKAMVMNFIHGGATINAIARQIGAEVLVIDMGVDGEFEQDERLISAKIRPGTRNFACEAAMTEEELDRALNTGWQMAEQAKKEGVNILALGEMGIANTTTASAVIAAVLKIKPELVTGKGTGIKDQVLQHKISVIEKALALHQAFLDQPFGILQRVGGYEIAAMTGAILAAASLELPVVIDGWVVAASALIASRLNPNVLDYLFFGHQSQEKGHQMVLEALRARPLLDLSMRLGEASGAALAIGILETGARIYNETATFDEAKVANKKQEGIPSKK